MFFFKCATFKYANVIASHYHKASYTQPTSTGISRVAELSDPFPFSLLIAAGSLD